VDLMHVHWPHNYASVPKGFKAVVSAARLLGLCFYHRLRGARIIWTVHDLHSLSTRNEGLEKLVMAVFTRLAGGLIFLNESSRKALYERRPYMRGLPFVIVPHGVYGDIYPPLQPQAAARQALHLPADKPFVLFAGSIKPYKNLEGLMQAMTAVCAESPFALVIAGQCDPPGYEPRIRELIERGRGQGADIVWMNQRLSDPLLAQVIDAADAVALPYSRTWNSGMAVLVLERGKRLICSNSEGFAEMSQELGEYWIALGNPDMRSAIARFDIRSAATLQDQHSLREFAARRQWPDIGLATAAFYRQVANRRSRDEPEPLTD
jgi:glycosyltransferase involved in cell wall biosynthesis